MSVKYSVIVLACNETISLEKVVNTIFLDKKNIDNVVIVSPKFATKECLLVQQKLKKKYSCALDIFIQTKKFPGYGGAIMYGFKKIKKNCKYFIWCDGDGETDPKVIKNMFVKIKESNSDIVSASRFLKSNILIKNYGIFNSILTFLFQYLCRMIFEKSITDYTVGYRMYKVSIFRKCNFKSYNQNFALESFIYFIIDKRKISEIHYNWTKRNDGTSQNNFFKKLSYFSIFWFGLKYIIK